MAPRKTRAILARFASPPLGICYLVRTSRTTHSTWTSLAGPPKEVLQKSHGESSITDMQLAATASKSLFALARKASQNASTPPQLSTTPLDPLSETTWSRNCSVSILDAAIISQHDSVMKDADSDSNSDAADVHVHADRRHTTPARGRPGRFVFHLVLLLQPSYWSTWHHERGFELTKRVSSSSRHSLPPANHLAPMTLASSNAAQVGVPDLTGQDTHETTSHYTCSVRCHLFSRNAR